MNTVSLQQSDVVVCHLRAIAALPTYLQPILYHQQYPWTGSAVLIFLFYH